MSRRKELCPGTEINTLIFVKEAPPKKWASRGIFLCTCGKEFEARVSSVTSGNTTTCGCGKGLGVPRKYGDLSCAEMPEYSVWADIKKRTSGVLKKNNSSYYRRGIKICDRWKNSFENFYKDMGPRPSDKHSIDRIDNDGNYEPSNCRWVTQLEQNRNKSNNRLITIGGETKILQEWLEFLKIPLSSYRNRVIRGMSPVEALTKPFQKRTKPIP